MWQRIAPRVLSLFTACAEDDETSTILAEDLAYCHYRPAAPEIYRRYLQSNNPYELAAFAKDLASLSYAKAIPAIRQLCKTTNFTAEWVLDRWEHDNLRVLPEMSLLRLTGPWGKPDDGVRALLVARRKDRRENR